MSSATHVAPGYDVGELRRREFPWTAETVYLNHASVGPLPERTRVALEAFNRKRSAPFQLPDRDLIHTLAESRRLAAQLIGAAPGIGSAILLAQLSDRTDSLFAYVLAACFLGLMINALLMWAQRKVLWWHPSMRDRTK